MRLVSALAVAAMLFLPAASAQEAYQAALTGVNEIPAVTTPAFGNLQVFVDGTTLRAQGSFKDLSSEYVAAHIHQGTPAENGPVALTLTAGLSIDQKEGSWEFGDNTFAISQALADSIASGLAYVNVHSVTNPGGEIRGQIVSSARTADVLITGVFDGPLANGSPKVIELYVAGDVADLSRYAVGSANNGGGTDGPELVLPVGAATPGTFLTITNDGAAFTTYFSGTATVVNAVAEINGDDAIELFYDADDNGDFARTEVVDVFGEVSVDGTGQVWEYTDGWAYRKDGTNVGGDIFTPTDWTYSGVGANAGQTTNAAAPTPFPLATFSPTDASPTARVQVIHNSPDPAADTVDVYITTSTETQKIEDVVFRSATPFLSVPAGVELTVDITDYAAVDNSAPVFTQAFTLNADSLYQIVATGVVGSGFAANPDGVSIAFSLLTTPTYPQEFALGSVFVRFIHGAPDAPAVDLLGTLQSGGVSAEVTIVDNAQFATVTDGGSGGSGADLKTLTVTTADQATTVGAYTLNASAGGGVTILASGFLTPAANNDGPAFGLLAVSEDGTATLLANATANEATARAAGMDLRIRNPIASSTPVAFDGGVAGRLRLEVFDALGRRVLELLNETVAPGERSAVLDASGLAPGAYVLRLTGEAGALTRTLTVVR